MLSRALVLVAACGACGAKDPARTDEPAPRVPPVVAPIPATPPFEIAAPTDKLVSVGRGARHACVVRESGAVDCWGQHVTCQKCDVQPAADATVRRVPGVTDARSISADARCVLRKTGEVACLAPDRLEFVALPGLTDVTYLDSGSNCFVHGGGRVACRDPETQKLFPLPGVRDAVAVSSDAIMGCIVRTSGDVMCGKVYEPGPLNKLYGIPRVKDFTLAGDREHRACYTALDGMTACIGVTYDVEPGAHLQPLGRDVDRTVLSHPERFKGATQLALGGQLSLEALVNGHVLIDDLGGSTTEVPLLADAVQHVHGCAIRAQGSLVCWGDNAGGVLAQPTTISALHAPPAPVAGTSDVVDLALGTLAGYALTRGGQVLRWGKRGLGAIATRATPMSLGLGPHDLVEITADQAGRLCVRSKAGEVWCQLEHQHANDRRIAQLDTEDIASISPGNGRLYAVRRDGRAEMHMTRLEGVVPSEDMELDAPVIGSSGRFEDLRCWMRSDHTVGCPRTIQGIAHATALATGPDFSCVIQIGNVACWTVRMDDKGTPHESPLLHVAGIHDATDIAAGYDYACAVHSGGKVSCFHFDAKDGTLLPTVDVLDGGAVDVELTYGFAGQIDASRQLHGPEPAGETACAIMRDYTVTCWGTNLAGETGDGSLVESTSPIGVVL